jgi:hypothetical protein
MMKRVWNQIGYSNGMRAHENQEIAPACTTPEVFTALRVHIVASGLWHHTVWYVDASLSKEDIASIFKVLRVLLRNFGTHLPDYMVSWHRRHNIFVHDL